MIPQRPIKDKKATIGKNDKGEQIIKIVYPYNLETLFQIRTLPGRKYHKKQQCWSAPIHVGTIKTLVEWNFSIDQHLLQYLQDIDYKKNTIVKDGIKGLKGTPYAFQYEGVAFIDSKHGRALIADEMGLGKTIQAIAWLQLHPEIRPAILVVPAFLKLNWERELYKWMPDPNPEILKGKKVHVPKGDIIIINYDILQAWGKTLKAVNPKVIIGDEIHLVKNNKALRTKALKMLAKGVPHFIALSGTPIENRPIEIFNAVNIIDPEVFPNDWKFKERYCGAKYNGFGWDFNGATNIPELHTTLSTTVMLRRKKKDVLKELPNKVWSFVPMELDNRKEYTEAENNFIQWVHTTKGEEAAERAKGAEMLSSIEALKQLAVKGKLNQAMDWVEDFLQSGKKLVIFVTHKFAMQFIMDEFPDISVKVDGSVSTKKKQEAVDQFQNNKKIKLFVGNIKAAGVGINLTAASDVAFLELPWTPGALEQASDRVHRIGQKNSVSIYYLLAHETIEDRIATMIDKKRKVLDGILDGKNTDSGSLLTELLKQF